MITTDIEHYDLARLNSRRHHHLKQLLAELHVEGVARGETIRYGDFARHEIM